MVGNVLNGPAKDNPHMDVIFEKRIVQGNVAREKPPHVSIHNVKYTNAVLRSMSSAIGYQLIVRIDSRDMRSVHGHFESGEDAGILIADSV